MYEERFFFLEVSRNFPIIHFFNKEKFIKTETFYWNAFFCSFYKDPFSCPEGNFCSAKRLILSKTKDFLTHSLCSACERKNIFKVPALNIKE